MERVFKKLLTGSMSEIPHIVNVISSGFQGPELPASCPNYPNCLRIARELPHKNPSLMLENKKPCDFKHLLGNLINAQNLVEESTQAKYKAMRVSNGRVLPQHSERLRNL